MQSGQRAPNPGEGIPDRLAITSRPKARAGVALLCTRMMFLRHPVVRGVTDDQLASGTS